MLMILLSLLQLLNSCLSGAPGKYIHIIHRHIFTHTPVMNIHHDKPSDPYVQQMVDGVVETRV